MTGETATRPRLLVVDDDRSIRASLTERFKARGYDVTTADSGLTAVEKARQGVDVILLDLQLPQGDGLFVLNALREEEIDATVIVITAYGTVDKAVEAMKAGAYDFVQKPFDPTLVEETLRRALERGQLLRTNRALRADADSNEIICKAPKMSRAVDMARRAAQSASSVLLLGESGTGKEVIARKLHEWSPRNTGPFVAVNCAAITESLLESELFGHEKGAFTGATARKEGKLEAAHGGTLFLDEIGDTPLAFQVKLLRVLQERTFERVGGNQSVQVDIRIVAATHRDLKKLIAAGDFREDLYYRLNVIAIDLPPLRDRVEDIVPLAEAFVASFGAKRAIANETEKLLELYGWPGNVRELRNVVERAVVLCENDQILPEDLAPELFASADGALPTGFHEKVEAHRKEILREALERTDGNQTHAAKNLGLQRTYLARLIKKYGLSS